MPNISITRVPRLRRMSLSVKPGGEIVVRAPKRVADREIESFITKNSKWIEKQRSKLSEFIPITSARIRELTEQAKIYLPERTKAIADKLGLTFQNVTIRHQKSRWGSCSHRDSINLNCELMRLPPLLRDYIIVHELAHTRHKHHQSAFWNYLEELMPGAIELDREMKHWKIGFEKSMQTPLQSHEDTLQR